MAKIEIYTRPFCGYCRLALNLLQAKSADYEQINVMINLKKRLEMQQRSQRQTLPQIFINNQAIGGCDELYALEKQGKLDKLLTEPAL